MDAPVRPAPGRPPRHLRHLPAATLLAAYAAWFAWLSVTVQRAWSTPGYDMGVFDQGVWLLSRFRDPFVTVMGRNLFGDHTSFILLLAVPLYWVHPAAAVLLVLQALLIAGAGVPLYLLGLRLLGGTLPATMVVAAYVLDPGLQHGNLEQFHPECFLVCAMAWAIWAAAEWRPRVLAASVVAALLVKEDTALLVVPLGLWVAWRRSRRAGAVMVAGAAASMAVDYLVVIRSLLGTDNFYGNRIPFGGIRGSIATTFTHPGRVARYLTSGGRPWYLWQLGWSTGWAWVLAPEVAAIAALTFAEDTVSNFPYMHELGYHYTLPLIPVLVAATAWGLSRLPTARLRGAASVAVATSAAASCVLWGLAPFSLGPGVPHLRPGGRTVAGLRWVAAALPAQASVSAWYSFVPQVDHRVRCYQWPTPFSAHYWGLYQQEGQRLPFASSVQYLFLPTALGPSDLAVLDGIRSEYRVVRSDAEATLWERTAP